MLAKRLRLYSGFGVVASRRASETVGGCSGCSSVNIVGGHGRIPDGEQVAQRAVEDAGSGVQ